MMSEYGFTKRDWALFKEKIAGWQEDYMDYISANSKTPPSNTISFPSSSL